MNKITLLILTALLAACSSGAGGEQGGAKGNISDSRTTAFKSFMPTFSDMRKMANGDAVPVIWQKPAEFKAQQDKFVAAVDKLNTVAQTGKLDDIKVAVGDVGANCKACHESFRVAK